MVLRSEEEKESKGTSVMSNRDGPACLGRSVENGFARQGRVSHLVHGTGSYKG